MWSPKFKSLEQRVADHAVEREEISEAILDAKQGQANVIAQASARMVELQELLKVHSA